MKIIGITGGIGSGKSEVLSYLAQRYEAVVCQSDEVAKELQRKGQECAQKIVEYFGEKILDVDGEIDRSALAAIVFADERELVALNQLVHPAVKREIKRRIRREQEKGTGLFALESALMLEEHYEALCDEVWYIYVEDATRMERLLASRGYSADRIRQIFQSQHTKEEFFSCCDSVIDNNAGMKEMRAQIDVLIKDKEKE